MSPVEFSQKVAFRVRCGMLSPASVGRFLWWTAQGAKFGRGTRVPRLSINWPHQVSVGRQCGLEDDVCFKFDGPWQPGPSIVVGDRVFIGRGCEFNVRLRVVVEDDARIAAGCRFIDHDHEIAPIGRWQGGAGREGPIVVGDDAWVGANAVVLRGVTIGRGAIVGAGAVVSRSVPPYEIWAGVPARKIGTRPTGIAFGTAPSPATSAGDAPAVTPTVTVAICTFNRADLLAEAIASVRCQTFADFELLLCDDASTDRTTEVCVAAAAADPRVRVVRHPTNVGMAVNWTSAVDAARGRYFAKLDDDNRYLPTFLATLLAALQAAPQAGVAFCDEWVIGPDGGRLEMDTTASTRRYHRDVLRGGIQPDATVLAAEQSLSINACVIDRSALIRAGSFQPSAGSAADCNLFLGLAADRVRATYVPERLSEYRLHAGQTTADLASNRDKAAAAVRMWQARRFTGRAERARRIKVRRAVMSLARASLLHGDLAVGRTWSRRAVGFAPLSPHAWVGALFAHAPRRVVQWLLRHRYGEVIPVGRPADRALDR